MGSNKFSAKEVEMIGKLLARKLSGTRFQQKMIRHELRTKYEFNISDFGTPGEAYGPAQLEESLKRGHIVILDDATIESMKEKRARDKARDEAQQEQEAIAAGEQTDWRKAQEEWEEYYGKS